MVGLTASRPVPLLMSVHRVASLWCDRWWRPFHGRWQNSRYEISIGIRRRTIADGQKWWNRKWIEISETSTSISVSELHIISIKMGADAFVQNRNTLRIHVFIKIANSGGNGDAASWISSGGILDPRWASTQRSCLFSGDAHVTTIRALSGHVRPSHRLCLESTLNFFF